MTQAADRGLHNIQRAVPYVYEWIQTGEVKTLAERFPVPWPSEVTVPASAATIAVGTAVIPSEIEVRAFPSINEQGEPVSSHKMILRCEPFSKNSDSSCMKVEKPGRLLFELPDLAPDDKYLTVFATWPVPTANGSNEPLLEDVTAAWLLGVKPQ